MQPDTTKVAIDALESFGDPSRGVRLSSEMRHAIEGGLMEINTLTGTVVLDARHVLRRLLLHLPRLPRNQLVDPRVLAHETLRIVAEVVDRRAELSFSLRIPRSHVADLRQMVLGVVDRDVALEIHQTLHYLQSPRDGMHFGLYSRPGQHPSDLHALFTLSPLDVPHLIRSLPVAVAPSCALVLSRLYAFPNTNPNLLSYGLGLLARTLVRTGAEAQILLTYLNPNLGFSGSVYRAANWHYFGSEPKAGYLFHDEHYVTEREAFAISSDSRGVARLALKRSELPLRPLEIYAYTLGRRTRDRRTVPFQPRSIMPSR